MENTRRSDGSRRRRDVPLGARHRGLLRVTAYSAGFTWWQIVGIATVVLAGSSEFVFVGIIAAGGAPIVGALAGILVNTRNFGYGLAVGKHLRGGPGMLVRAHLINDESAAMATAERDPGRARAAFLLCGAGILVAFSAGISSATRWAE